MNRRRGPHIDLQPRAWGRPLTATDDQSPDPSDAAPLVRLGTRGSALARWQADHITACLEALGAKVEQTLVKTTGDQNQQGPIGSLGGQGVFTKEIQRVLLDGEVDLAVHSLKDLPTDPTPGLWLAAVPERERPGDVIVCREAEGFEDLPAGAVVGTGSVRRQAQLLHRRPELTMQDIRGNVETRLQKLDDGQYDAIVLAEAGITRLGLQDRITEVLPREIILPAVGQGALGLEIREDDQPLAELLASLIDTATMAAVTAERSLLRALRGGCMAPVGALAELQDEGLRLEAVVLSRDGQQRLHTIHTGAVDQAESLGIAAADELLAAGADKLIEAARE